MDYVYGLLQYIGKPEKLVICLCEGLTPRSSFLYFVLFGYGGVIAADVSLHLSTYFAVMSAPSLFCCHYSVPELRGAGEGGNPKQEVHSHISWLHV